MRDNVKGGLSDFDSQEAVDYHYGFFPPENLEYDRLLRPLSNAASALARYDALLEGLHNKDLLLAPLRNVEAVVSSRIEGTIATLDEILQIQADEENDEDGGSDALRRFRSEAIEVYSYGRAIKRAQALMQNEGLPICSRMFQEAHSRLLFFGRGADKTPGHYKAEQNYVVDRGRKKILFIPASAKELPDGIKQLESYINDENIDALIQTAVAHAEFEALHPFKDGNGRLGRMLIPLNLWDKKKICEPYFYVSAAIERRKDEYIDTLRMVSANHAWTDWIVLFLHIMQEQANENITIIKRIMDHYNEMRDEFREVLASRWSVNALDYVFGNPIFRNSSFTKKSGIPAQTAHRFTNKLIKAGYLTVIAPASGRRSALYAFTSLLDIVRQ